MTRSSQVTAVREYRDPPVWQGDIPKQLAAILRPGLSSLADEIANEIPRIIPDYARPFDERYGHATKRGIDRAVNLFVDLLENPSAPANLRDETCRKLGEGEAREGRTLDNLQAAYRIGARVAWERIMRVGRRHNLSSAVMSKLASLVFIYIDELAALSIEGYRQAMAKIGEGDQESRRRLLQLLLEQPAVSAETVSDLAYKIGWAVPEQVAVVAVEADAHGAVQPDIALDPEVLADLRGPAPHVLIPGRVTADRRRKLGAAFLGTRISIGPAVRLAEAVSSLRWARQALRLVRDGLLPDGLVTDCERHLTSLWLLSDQELVDQITRRRLSALDNLAPTQRQRLGRTLLAWLETQGNTKDIAARLQVHPQTVRYRMRKIESTFGDQLRDSDARFELEVALRAARLHWGKNDTED